MKNALNTLTFEGHEVKVAKTGYTGEPLGYEVYCRSEDAAWLWNRLVELGARARRSGRTGHPPHGGGLPPVRP